MLDDDAAKGATDLSRGMGRTKAQKRAESGANKGGATGRLSTAWSCASASRRARDVILGSLGSGVAITTTCVRTTAKPPDIAFPRAADVQHLPLPGAMDADIDSDAACLAMFPVFEETG
ncbi:hypothetical protein B0H15DRAFT_956365 [Mycena belliarum]|uniref:Uncharacterized protein n=1 Tax=Mycena belliarum TaxID=1033014 RepID=A0AAD6XHN5_9AGAR|nr:hypothetical protein B0H15DRAFT_956365 [Mycena belliae]